MFDNDKHNPGQPLFIANLFEYLRLGASYYNDVISAGAEKLHDEVFHTQINQQLFTGSVSYFGKKLEPLAEATSGINHTDSIGNAQTLAMYVYAVINFRKNGFHISATINCNNEARTIL
jgi:hypothetical protein